MTRSGFCWKPVLAALLACSMSLPMAGAAQAARPSAPALDLSAYKGKVVYLDFWASWCIPCRQSFPYMKELALRYGPGNFAVVAIDVDHDQDQAQAFIDLFHPNFPIVFDPKGRIADAYKIKDMPTSFLIDQNGQVRFTHEGFHPSQESTYERQIAELLNDSH